jgi:hypothetical protein
MCIQPVTPESNFTLYQISFSFAQTKTARPFLLSPYYGVSALVSTQVHVAIGVIDDATMLLHVSKTFIFARDSFLRMAGCFNIKRQPSKPNSAAIFTKPESLILACIVMAAIRIAKVPSANRILSRCFQHLARKR